MNNIPDNIIHRAVDLWCRKLHSPVFDNGDNSAHGGMAMALATINIESAKNKTKDIESKIEIFRKALSDSLIYDRDNKDHFYPSLSVDYHPCSELASAADIAEIPHTLFSCKTSIYLDENKVSVSSGYGAEDVCHYPLPSGGWLITTLSGSDIYKIIDSISKGNPLNLNVEEGKSHAASNS